MEARDNLRCWPAMVIVSNLSLNQALLFDL